MSKLERLFENKTFQKVTAYALMAPAVVGIGGAAVYGFITLNPLMMTCTAICGICWFLNK